MPRVASCQECHNKHSHIAQPLCCCCWLLDRGNMVYQHGIAHQAPILPIDALQQPQPPPAVTDLQTAAKRLCCPAVVSICGLPFLHSRARPSNPRAPQRHRSPYSLVHEAQLSQFMQQCAQATRQYQLVLWRYCEAGAWRCWVCCC